MTTVFAPLVEEVELVEAVDPEVDPGIPTQPTPGRENTVQDELDVPEVGMVVGMGREVGMSVGIEVGMMLSMGSVTASSGFELDDEELDDEDEELDDEDPLLPGSSVRTCAVATPCQTMPTSIIPAATAAKRLTVVRRPGLISNLFPSN